MPTKYKGTIQEVTALNTFINFTRASMSLNARMYKYYVDYGLTESQFGVLSTLYFNTDPMNQKDIASRLLTTAGNMTMVIDNLVKSELIKKTRDNSDRRIINISLTEKGYNLIEDLFPRHVKAIASELSSLSMEEQEVLRKLCRKVGKGNENI